MYYAIIAHFSDPSNIFLLRISWKLRQDDFDCLHQHRPSSKIPKDLSTGSLSGINLTGLEENHVKSPLLQAATSCIFLSFIYKCPYLPTCHSNKQLYPDAVWLLRAAVISSLNKHQLQGFISEITSLFARPEIKSLWLLGMGAPNFYQQPLWFNLNALKILRWSHSRNHI